MISSSRSLSTICCFAATGLTMLYLESSSARAQPTACLSWSPQLEEVYSHVPRATTEYVSNQYVEAMFNSGVAQSAYSNFPSVSRTITLDVAASNLICAFEPSENSSVSTASSC